jgi:hypothetical protein
MAFYDIDFIEQSPELLPPDKRVEPNISLVQALFKPIQWLRDLMFTSYKSGSEASTYSPGTYDKYDQVIYGKKVYSSLKDSNTDLPTVTTSWEIIQSNFVGVEERVRYNAQKIVFEWALNRWFSTTFRQPPNTSDIYITNVIPPVSVFRVGGDESNSSQVFTKHSSEFIINSYSFNAISNFTIHVPLAVYNALGDASNREGIFRSFADKYVAAGLSYSISTY